ncbi:MAG: hypothetical protein ABIQ18_47730 [Umezawaea sp.]
MSKQYVTDALDVLRQARGRMVQVRSGYRQAAEAVRREVAEDPSLSEDGRRTAMRDRQAALSPHHTTRLDSIRADIANAERAIAVAMLASWPKPAAGVEAMLTRQATWARCRALLESNPSQSVFKRINNLLSATKDTETLLVLREELPTWAVIQGVDASNSAAVELIVDKRTAAVVDASDVLEAALESRALLTGIQPMLNVAASEVAGADVGDALGALVTSSLAEHEVRRTQTLVEATETESGPNRIDLG